ncbi:MAG: hypothetical protein HZB26_26575 [Candidatus Hydrogenedentes bacterium]|nr:hypothetical protein [Candidatus Hydrogenedentota bacterium]
MAISWTLGSRSSALAIVVMVTLAFPMVVGYEELRRTLELSPLMFFLPYLCLCAGLSAWGARREGRTAAPLIIALSGLVARRRSSQVQRFADPNVAQSWFEWRTRGLLLPLTMLAIVLTPALLVGSTYLISRNPSIWAIVNVVALYVCDAIPKAVPVASGLTGIFFLFSDWRVFQSRRGSESALRPVCSRTLAQARFRAMACSTVVTYGMSGMTYVWAASCLQDKGHNYTLTFLCAQPHAAILTPILICAYFILAWSLLWTPLPVLAMGFWTFVIVAPVAALYSALGSGDIDRVTGFSIAALGAPASLLFLGTIAGGIWCRRRKLVSLRAVWIAVGLCVVFWIGLMDLGRWERDPLVWDRAVRSFEPQAVRYAILSALASSLPAFAVFSQAIWVDRLRYHR